MLKKCSIVLADEPTGSLDKKNSEIVMNILHELSEQGKTVIVVWIMETLGRITLSLWSWRESLEPFHKISNPIKYQIIKYLYFYTFNLNIS